MKASELRIGNILSVNGVYNAVTGIRNIFIGDNPKDVVEVEISGFSQVVILNEQSISPIPLAEEWLLKFGFKCIHEANKHYAIQNPKGYKDLHKIHFFQTINDQWHLAFSDATTGKEHHHIVACHIKYVHQLQNLYYALTGEELTTK